MQTTELHIKKSVGNILEPDERLPNQKRLDELIEINDDILEELKILNVANKKLLEQNSIIGNALLKLLEKSGKKITAK